MGKRILCDACRAFDWFSAKKIPFLKKSVLKILSLRIFVNKINISYITVTQYDETDTGSDYNEFNFHSCCSFLVPQFKHVFVLSKEPSH